MLPERAGLLGLWRKGSPDLEVGGVVAKRVESNEMKLLASHTACRHKFTLYLGWAEAPSLPGPAVSVLGRTLVRHSWRQKTS